MLCAYMRPRYQVSVNRTIGRLVFKFSPNILFIIPYQLTKFQVHSFNTFLRNLQTYILIFQRAVILQGVVIKKRICYFL